MPTIGRPNTWYDNAVAPKVTATHGCHRVPTVSHSSIQRIAAQVSRQLLQSETLPDVPDLPWNGEHQPNGTCHLIRLHRRVLWLPSYLRYHQSRGYSTTCPTTSHSHGCWWQPLHCGRDAHDVAQSRPAFAWAWCCSGSCGRHVSPSLTPCTWFTATCTQHVTRSSHTPAFTRAHRRRNSRK